MNFVNYLTPVQKLGALGVVVLTVFYMVTAAVTGEGKVDPTLISVFGSMVGIEEARKALKGTDPPPPVAPASPPPGEPE